MTPRKKLEYLRWRAVKEGLLCGGGVGVVIKVNLFDVNNKQTQVFQGWSGMTVNSRSIVRNLALEGSPNYQKPHIPD